jgi:hypothetical protein
MELRNVNEWPAEVRDTRLLSTFTVADYYEMERIRDRARIANLIQQRFSERYSLSLTDVPTRKSGFCIMAVSCLMIEALESMLQGWPDTRRRGMGERAFRCFFARPHGLSAFGVLTSEFYEHVRCGILHQGETTGGWRIRRKGPLLDVGTRTVNATRFGDLLAEYLDACCETLRDADWDGELWRNVRHKMRFICQNCVRKEGR